MRSHNRHKQPAFVVATVRKEGHSRNNEAAHYKYPGRTSYYSSTSYILEARTFYDALAAWPLAQRPYNSQDSESSGDPRRLNSALELSALLSY